MVAKANSCDLQERGGKRGPRIETTNPPQQLYEYPQQIGHQASSGGSHRAIERADAAAAAQAGGDPDSDSDASSGLSLAPSKSGSCDSAGSSPSDSFGIGARQRRKGSLLIASFFHEELLTLELSKFKSPTKHLKSASCDADPVVSKIFPKLRAFVRSPSSSSA
mmetsp:Transcript_16083/g.39132  ORF Transcript_16083/g.39132 Transcript_16083/m.39132 type:complete len:164 (+) Transcript_16083:32-523(+)